MLKSNVAWSTDNDSYAAGKSIAQTAVVDLIETKVALLFTSVDYDQQKVIDGAKEVLGTAPIVGCTSSAGIITPEGFISSDHGFAGMLALGDEDLSVGVASSPKKGDARETGRKVAKEAMKNSKAKGKPAYFLMIASPGEEESYMKGIQDIVGEIPAFGGSAADNTVEGKWSIFTADKIFTDGVAVALFYTDKPMKNVYSGFYNETKDVGIITKVDGKRRLMEIDGVPAVKKYAQWSGKAEADLMGANLLVETVTGPLGVKDRLGDLVAVRHPMFANDDLSMNIGNDLAEGTAIMRLDGSVDTLISGAEAAMKEVNSDAPDFGAYFLVHCGGRRLAIDSRINEVADKLKKQAKGVPFLAVFTFGEYGLREHGGNVCGGLTLSFTGFSK